MRRDSVGCKDSSGPVAHPPNHMIIMSCIFSIADKSERGSTPYFPPFSARGTISKLQVRYLQASGQKMFFLTPHFMHFRASGLPSMCRSRDLESNAIIGVEIYEFRQKLKNLEFLQNSSFWQSPGTIWIDFVSVEVVPSFFFFAVFFGWSGNLGGRLRG